jgi:peptide/nickel transport system ATP-binding protein
MTPLLEIRDLEVGFESGAGMLRAVDGVSLSIGPGETLGLVGESGSGKTVTALSIARLVPSPPAHYLGGQIRLEGRDVLSMSPMELRSIRGQAVSYVFQEPGVSLNPVMRVGSQIRESLRLHRPEAATAAEVVKWMKRVGIPDPESRARSYPHELSGGMQQRVMIAMALASHPRLLVADEPTTALDVTIQAQILELLRALQHELGMAILLITHNLGIVSGLAERVAVMYAGQIIETALTRDLLQRPAHPYTRALLDSVPVLGAGRARLTAIPGAVPASSAPPSGCRFHPRCPHARENCSRELPLLSEVAPGRMVRCPYPILAPQGATSFPLVPP